MRPEDRDAAYLWDMIEAARDIAEFVKGVHYVHFAAGKQVRYAVERQLTVIGEAANLVRCDQKGTGSDPRAGTPHSPVAAYLPLNRGITSRAKRSMFSLCSSSSMPWKLAMK